MLIIISKNYKELSKRAAGIVIDEIDKKPNLVIGFPTGETPLGMYKLLVKAYKNKKLDFSHVKSFNLDEYYPMKKSNKNSYHHYMNNNLFNHVNVKKSNVNILDGEAKNWKKECLAYENKIKKNPIDIQILGVGVNGHIGFNEPGSSFNSKTRLVELNKNSIQKKALSVGISTIMSAKKIILLASGKNKTLAIKNLVEGNISSKWPVSFLKKHRKFIVIIDKDAAGLLRT